MKNQLRWMLCFLSISFVSAQDYFPENGELKEKNTNYTAFTNATLYVTPTKVIKNGTLLIQNGKVVASGKSVSIPENAITIDLNDMHIYPSFIDAYTDFGVKKPKRAEGNGRSPQYEASRDGFYWNDHIMPENEAIAKFSYDDKKAKEFRDAGFGVLNTHIMDGIARGTGVLVALNDDEGAGTRIINDKSVEVSIIIHIVQRCG